MKSELKQLASELRNDKADIKQTQKECGSGAACGQQAAIVTKKRTCRHKHIAYSMVRGRTYEQIEAKCAKDNQPDMDLIQRIISEYNGSRKPCRGPVCFGSSGKAWGNQTILFLGVRNLIELRAWEVELRENYKVFSVFREVDLDNQETAIACYDTGEIFRKLSLA